MVRTNNCIKFLLFTYLYVFVRSLVHHLNSLFDVTIILFSQKQTCATDIIQRQSLSEGLQDAAKHLPPLE